MTIQLLQNLVHQFTSHEHTLIRYALKGSKEENEENKSLRLFEYVVAQGKNSSRSGASIAIYHAPPDTRINKLISRLWERILEIITSESFLRKNERLNEQDLLRIGVRKKILQCATLTYLNGSSDLTRLLIENGIRDAEKVESTEMLIDLYHFKRVMTLFSNNKKEYNFCIRQITYYEKCRGVAQKLLFYYDEIVKNNDRGNYKSPKEKLKYLECALSELRKEKKYMNSVQSKKLFAIIQVEYLFHKDNYVAAKKTLQKLLLDLGSLFMAGGRTRLAARVEGELSTCELFSGNYDQAIKHSEKALSMIWSNDKQNYYVSLDGLFYAVFYKADFDRAEKIIVDFQSDQNPIKNDFLSTKPHFFQACIHFKKREFKQALKIISKSLPLNKDKTGYDIAIRVLRIQCLLALNRFDEAMSHVENLRKHISRNSKKTYTSERDKLIARVLVLMQKRGFSGKQNKTESELIKKLAAASGQYKWMPRTPELIRFHEWYKETVKGIPLAEKA